MKKTIIKETPAGQVIYNFEDYVCLDYSNVAITGNRHFNEYGDPEILDIIKGDYYDSEIGYDYDAINELEKITGKKWSKTSICGYSQGEWQYIYYAEETISNENLRFIESFYFNKLNEYEIINNDNEENDYFEFIPHDIAWKGKKAICEYLGLFPEECTLMEIKGQHIAYDYAEI